MHTTTFLRSTRRHAVGRVVAALLAVAAVTGAPALTASGAAPTSSTTAAASSPGQRYFVDCSRKAAGSGTMAAPWGSVNGINQHAAFQPGDSILLRRGTACVGRIAPRGSGAAGAPITLGAWGSGAKPAVHGGGTKDGTGTVSLTGQEWWTVQDLRVTNRNSHRETTAYRAGVYVRNMGTTPLHGITLRRLRVESVVSNLMFMRNTDARDFGGIAVYSAPVGSGGFRGLTIAGNHVQWTGRSGIVTTNAAYPSKDGHPRGWDDGTRITGNTVVESRGDGILLRGAKNARIDHNRVARAASFWPCKQCGKPTPLTANAAVWPAWSKNVRIDHNEVYGTHLPGGDGEAFDIDLSAVDTVLEHNYAHDNEGGGVLLCGAIRTTVRFNILENNERGSITFIRKIPAQQTVIHNNTIFIARGTKGAKVVRTFNTAPKGKRIAGVRFFNNLVYNGVSSAYEWPTTPRTAKNVLVGLHPSHEPAGSRASAARVGLRKPGSGGTGMGTVSGYRPKHGSRFTGEALSGTGLTDFFGRKIDSRHPPVGAAS